MTADITVYAQWTAIAPDKPAAPSPVTFGPVTGGTLIKWGASADATGYQVWAGTRLLGTTGPGTLSLFVAEVLGPNAGIKVIALGGEGAASDPGMGVYKASAPAKLGAVRFSANSPKLTPAAKRALRAYAKTVAAQGFTSIGVKGYTATYSDRGTWSFRKRLSIARAKNVKAYLASQFKSPACDRCNQRNRLRKPESCGVEQDGLRARQEPPRGGLHQVVAGSSTSDPAGHWLPAGSLRSRRRGAHAARPLWVAPRLQ